MQAFGNGQGSIFWTGPWTLAGYQAQKLPFASKPFPVIGKERKTYFEMGALESVGMLKMDLLGLKTLTVLHDAVEMIAARHGTAPQMHELALDDPRAYELLRRGRTAGAPTDCCRRCSGRRWPSSAQVWLGLARLRRERGDAKGAQQALARARSLRPSVEPASSR